MLNGHTCTLTTTTVDGSIPPPCPACQEAFASGHRGIPRTDDDGERRGNIHAPGTSPRAEPDPIRLLGALQDPIHKESGNTRAAKATRPEPEPQRGTIERLMDIAARASISSDPEAWSKGINECCDLIRERDRKQRAAASAETVRAVCEWLRGWPRKRNYERKGISVAVYNDEAHCIADDIESGAWKKGGRVP